MRVNRQLWCGVYAATRRIPRGRVATYADIAHAVGRPRAWRHVGAVLSKNRNRNTPCHRVVRSDGTVGGFGFPGGSAEKIRRLRRDGVQIKNGGINLRKYRIQSPKTLVAGH